jgi:UDP-N-acetylmuramyl pentapeptide phosphotransferase/UDP-N-acetylglucosamine-1-phosphate transferase
MTIYLLGAFLLSLICGVTFTPLILDFCKRKKLYDIPNERKVHKNAIPRLGGISFLPSMLAAFLIIILFMPVSENYTLPINLWSAIFLLGLMMIYATGIIDDLVGLNATTKFFVQIVTAAILSMAGLYINNLYGLFGIYEIPAYVGIPLTTFTIVFIDNAINLIDGIDGLAAGLSLLALTGFLCYFIHYEVFSHTYNIMVAGLMGALTAFCYFNLFGKTERNTRIFMGDSGSLSLGYILGFLAIKCSMDNPAIWPSREDAILVPLTLLFVPTADVVRVTFYRLFHHQPLFRADKNHIHHKLMQAGLSQHQALITILTLAVLFIVINSLLYYYTTPTLIVLIDVLTYCIFNVYINLKTKPASA